MAILFVALLSQSQLASSPNQTSSRACKNSLVRLLSLNSLLLFPSLVIARTPPQKDLSTPLDSRIVPLVAQSMKHLVDETWYPAYYSSFPKKVFIEAAIAHSMLGSDAYLDSSTSAKNQEFSIESKTLCQTGSARIEGNTSGEASYRYGFDPAHPEKGHADSGPFKQATYDLSVPVSFHFENCETTSGKRIDGKASGHIDVKWIVESDPWFSGTFSLRNLKGSLKISNSRGVPEAQLNFDKLAGEFSSKDLQITGTNTEIGNFILAHMDCSGGIKLHSREAHSPVSCKDFFLEAASSESP